MTENSEPAELPPTIKDDPYAALRFKEYRRFLSGSLISLLGMQMQATAVGHEIFHQTNSNFAVAVVALVQFLPVLLLSLPAGQIADTYSRKRIVQCAMSVVTCSSLGLACLSFFHGPLWGMYLCLCLSGAARAFQQPAKSSLMPLIVPRSVFRNAVTWNSGAFQLGSIVGPAIAGLLIWSVGSYALIYLFEGLSTLTFVVLLSSISIPEPVRQAWSNPLQSFRQGWRFLFSQKVLLAAISLDLFAVLLGGATTLLPAYEKILHVGAWEFGLMRSAPAFGALLMSVLIAFRPPLQRAGRTLLLCVAGFGAATIVFGVSRSFPLSLAMLALLGALDMISVVIRHTLVQLMTPDEMRGRVQAVNGLFIGASNELGGFESGAVAAAFDRKDDPAFGPTVSVVTGGIGTILVVAYVARVCPPLRNYDRLEDGAH